MADIPGARIVLEAERTPGVTVREPSRTLSADALSRIIADMGGFVTSRMLRAMDRNAPPQRVAVHVYVELDGEAAE
jgi:hypothetical protein